MGQALSYRAGERSFSCRVGRADWQLVEEVRKHLPEDIDILFAVPHLGDEVEVPTRGLRAAAEKVARFMDDNPGLLPYTYQFKTESARPGFMPDGFGTGATSGLRLPGDDAHWYCIRAGVGKCLLEKWTTGADGKGCMIGQRDLRGERELQTTNLGRILIRRTRARSELRKILRQISAWIADAAVAQIVKRVA